jgi:hypothetical protein
MAAAGSARWPSRGRRSGRSPTGSVALLDRGWKETGVVMSSRSSSVFAGFRFPREVIVVAVRWYLRYGLSYRDAGELMAERGVTWLLAAGSSPAHGPGRGHQDFTVRMLVRSAHRA